MNTVYKMKSLYFLFLSILAINSINCEYYFYENFTTDPFENGWIYSEHPGKEYGKFEWSAGDFYSDPHADKGIKTTQDARFYALSRKFEEFSNKDKPLVIQFTVKHAQDIDCGGGYLKLFNCKLDQKDMHGDSPYEIMFGPDICGPGTKKVHAIFSYKGKNHLINKDIRCKDDVFTHLYTFIVKPDNTYEVLIDNEKVESGDLETDWDMLPPKKIKDPAAKKPDDWEDNSTIDDPEDKKPEDWDKPEKIPDAEANKPEDWDDDTDGEWEAPMISNPEYKGEWKPKQIDNPKYKGPWVHPEIDNPDYAPDPHLYKRDSICVVGFDLWQVKSGTIFDNVLLTADIDYAKQVGDEIIANRKAEKDMKEKLDKEKSDAAGDKPADDDDDDEDADDDAVDADAAPADDHDEL